MAEETAAETFARALEILDRIVKETVDTNVISPELTRVAVFMFQPTVRLLRVDAHMLATCESDEQRARVERASEQAGDLAIARAVIAAAEPYMPQYTTPKEN